jgi:hypothetical protein
MFDRRVILSAPTVDRELSPPSAAIILPRSRKATENPLNTNSILLSAAGGGQEIDSSTARMKL